MVDRVRPGQEVEEEAEAAGAEVEGEADLSHEELDGLVDMNKAEAVAFLQEGGEITSVVERLAHEVNECFVEAEKFDGGVKAAGTRIRKRLLYMNKATAILRNTISAIKADM